MSSSTIYWGYPWVAKYYILRVPLGPQVLYIGGTLESLSTIYWGYPWALKYYILGVPLGR